MSAPEDPQKYEPLDKWIDRVLDETVLVLVQEFLKEKYPMKAFLEHCLIGNAYNRDSVYTKRIWNNINISKVPR